ncbi:MMPL family transporter [Actinoplanes sp. CA-030573]|uniref:MMPL family transporter n=1 Tax=Actinoplanes sp. CA-030573 TaxID=3239898 RepID=UPI003D8EF210
MAYSNVMDTGEAAGYMPNKQGVGMSITVERPPHGGEDPSSRAWRPHSEPVVKVGPLGRLAGFAYRRRGAVLLGWLVALIAMTGLAMTVGGDFEADYSAPKSDSSAAQQLLQQRFAARSGEEIDVVVTVAARRPDTRAEVAALFSQLARMPHVVEASSPYSSRGLVSADGTVLLGHLRLDVTDAADMPVSDTRQLLSVAENRSVDGMTVALGGQAVSAAEEAPLNSEIIGIVAAAVILLITLGSVVAAGLPILVALAGLGVSLSVIPLVALAMPVPDWSTSLAAMIGIGIGIDYVLLMITRYREWRAEGLSAERATVATVDTAGRAVVVAGSTVVISMLGLFAMGLSFMRGAAVVTIAAVLVVMVAAVTLFPALLGYVGRHVERLRLPGFGNLFSAGRTTGRGFARWAALVERRRFLAATVGVAVLVGLALPMTGVHFGFPDAGNDPAGTSTRAAYNMIESGFGAGANGPLLLVAEVSPGRGVTQLDALVTGVTATPGVAAVLPPQLNQAGDTAVITVLPVTGPQDAATGDLVRVLRDHVIPAAAEGATVHVGGVTAISLDGTANVVRRLPLLIGGVVLLSMLLLLVAFRSLVIAVKAAMLNLLSVAAAYGVVAYVLEGGWAGHLLGIDNPTPLPAFIPVLMFAILFGLSMDYEVFLISRMRESYLRTGRPGPAVTSGLAATARVITAAAAIMVVVFAAFVPSPEIFLKIIGVGLATAILVDATIVRMVLVPAVMFALGRRAWWMPPLLERILPHLHVEGHAAAHLPAAEPQRPLISTRVL